MRRILAQREQEPCHSHVQNTEEQRVVVSVPQIWKKIGVAIQRIQQVRRCPTLIEVLVQEIQEQSVEVQRVIHNQECLQQHTVEYGVSNSSLEFERLRKHAKIALTVRSLQHTGASHRHEQPEGATDCRSFTDTAKR